MRPPDLDMDGLRTFVTIVDRGGFTAAGAALGRTQAAISIKIKKLEQTLGRRLFARTSRSLALTGDGTLLLDFARRILALNDEATRRFAEPEAEGAIRLGVAEYFVPEHLPTVLSRFARLFPRVAIDVKVGMSHALIDGLAAGAFDLVIAKRDDDGRAPGRVLCEERLRWVAAPPLAAALARDDAAPVQLCTLPPPCVFRARALAALQAQGRAWRIAYTSESVMGVLAAARAGLGVAVVGAGAIGPGLAILDGAAGFPDLGTVELVVLGERPDRRDARAALVGFIEEALAALPPPLRAA